MRADRSTKALTRGAQQVPDARVRTPAPKVTRPHDCRASVGAGRPLTKAPSVNSAPYTAPARHR